MKAENAGPPPGLLLPTYQNRLRVIGRQLDLGSLHAVTLLEVPGGFLVRAMSPGARAFDTLEYEHGGFPALLASAHAARGEGERRANTHPLLSTGYEDFLRALGHRLDGQQAEAITVAELDGFIAVGGLAKVERYAQTDIAPFQSLLRADEINELLDIAFRRRAAEVKPGSGFLRFKRR